jgi:hypothetical protein
MKSKLTRKEEVMHATTKQDFLKPVYFVSARTFTPLRCKDERKKAAAI